VNTFDMALAYVREAERRVRTAEEALKEGTLACDRSIVCKSVVSIWNTLLLALNDYYYLDSPSVELL